VSTRLARSMAVRNSRIDRAAELWGASHEVCNCEDGDAGPGSDG